MKVFGIVMKIVAALAVVAGIAFVVVKYGDQIVAWFKSTFGNLFCCNSCEETEVIDEVAVEEAPVEEVVEDGAVVAAENDFEG